MAVLDICTYPNPVLAKKAEPVTDFGEETQKFIDDLIETMWVKDGVGLAATQVGVSKRIFVAAPTMRKGEEYVMINPVLSDLRGRDVGPEGCLSLPGIQGDVARATRLHLEYVDRHGKPHSMDLKDFFARVVQHENDHLDGMVFIDRVDFEQRQALLAEYQSA